ncbi:MAG: hypothetical protein LBB06_01685 [Endomicrobium sp.]|nr:hypothetical protein [Endomicrobium sp.]
MKPFRISVVVLLVAFLWTLTGCKLIVRHEHDITDKFEKALNNDPAMEKKVSG